MSQISTDNHTYCTAYCRIKATFSSALLSCCACVQSLFSVCAAGRDIKQNMPLDSRCNAATYSIDWRRPPFTFPPRVKFLWRDALMVTDPSALAAICGRGEGALDKASVIYRPVNDMCSPLGHANLLTAPADEKWKVGLSRERARRQPADLIT